MKKFRVSKILLIFVIVATLVIGSSSISFASTSIKNLNYLGGGKVEISFAKKTRYKDLKISIKDNNGKTYKSKVSSKNSSKLSFKIYSYKTGKTYRISVSGLKDGNASATMEIISKKKAISTAKKKARKTWKAKSFTNVSATSTTYGSRGVWKVSFEAGDANYTYWISQYRGTVLRSERK